MEKIQDIAEKYGFKKVILFGARVKGKLHKERDFDIAFFTRLACLHYHFFPEGFSAGLWLQVWDYFDCRFDV